jgi:hypothetical protein
LIFCRILSLWLEKKQMREYQKWRRFWELFVPANKKPRHQKHVFPDRQTLFGAALRQGLFKYINF